MKDLKRRLDKHDCKRMPFGFAYGDDGFVSIPSPNLYPCVTDRPGIFVTGTAGGPMDIVDSVVMAGAAAAEAAAYIQEKETVPAYAD